MAAYPKNWENVTCCDWREDENRIWLCLENKNAVCEIDKKNRKVRIVGSFPHNGLGEKNLSLSIEKNGDYIVFCPFMANDIAILRISTGELDFINFTCFLSENKRAYAGTEKFYRMVSYENYILFLGIKYPAIMRLDLTTKKIDLFESWLEKVEKHKCKDAVFFTDGYAKKGNELYLPIGRCGGFLKVNMDTMAFDYMELDFTVRGILGMTQKENFIWFTEYDAEAKEFFQWNLDDGEMKRIGLPSRDAFYAPLYYNGSLMFFQNYRRKSYRYELKSGGWKDITDVMPGAAYSSDKKERGKEVAYFSSKGIFYRWNPQNNLVRFDEFKIEDESFLENAWIDYRGKRKRHEIKEGRLNLRDYLDEISSFYTYVSGEKENIYKIKDMEKKEIYNGEQIWKLVEMWER